MPTDQAHFAFYESCGKRLFSPPGPDACVVAALEGASAEEAFSARESKGECLPTREPERLALALRGKGGLNLQIREWAAGVAEFSFTLAELRDDWPDAPEWVWTAVLRQSPKVRQAIVARTGRDLCAEQSGMLRHRAAAFLRKPVSLVG